MHPFTEVDSFGRRKIRTVCRSWSLGWVAQEVVLPAFKHSAHSELAALVTGVAEKFWEPGAVDIGPIQATKDTEHHVSYGPIAGAIIAVGCVLLLVKGQS